MNNPVAWVYPDFFENLEKFHVWSAYKENFNDRIPLYIHPVKEQYKFGVDWSKDGNAVIVLKICEDGVAEVVFMDYQKATHPVKEQDESFDRTASHMAGEYVSYKKELTDEEILEIASPMFEDARYPSTALEFARTILKKAREK